jgi:hypothetical protein
MAFRSASVAVFGDREGLLAKLERQNGLREGKDHV